LGGDEIHDTDAPARDTSREETLGHDDNVAGLELECRDVKFYKTVSAEDKDSNALLGLLPILGVDKYPITVTYEYVLKNDGEIRECVTFAERFLCDDVDALIAAGKNLAYGSCPVCQGGASGVAPPGGQLSTKCEIVFSDPAALQALLEADDGRPECSDPNPLCYDNCATATVAACPLLGDPPVCDTPETCEGEAKICAGGECGVEVTKEVKCKEDSESFGDGFQCSADSANAGAPCTKDEDCAGGTCVDHQETMPGEDLTFRITIENTGPTEILHLCITDTLTCPDWLERDTCNAKHIDGNSGAETPVPHWIAGMKFDGTRHCIHLPDPPPDGAFSPGDKLVITCDLSVPAAPSFLPLPTDDVDCQNCVAVEGYTEPDANPAVDDPDCEDGPACAEIDVKVADVDCAKLVCADLDGDGTCAAGEFTNNLAMDVGATPFPLRLIYRFTAINPAGSSEVALKEVTITDEHFVADFINGGMTVQPNCLLCESDPCVETEDNTTASLADLPAPPPNQSAGFDCWVDVPSLAVWNAAFHGCNVNTATVTADADVDTDNCKTPVDSTCTAEVCFRPPCTCTKANFNIWNQNEVKFSGTHRCICHWDQAFISEYDAPNHMLRENLQTDKGKARITGVRSTEVCGEDSRNAPLIGLAAKRMTFASGDAMMAGMPLVGAGVDPNRYGQILYDPSDADPPPPELAGAPAGAERAVRVA
ncbi:MAG: hypothetical protein KJ749_03280, partial [Planctomycetes bacterium]|nr:hypothetical protein [Planctomycetota bacterium]